MNRRIHITGASGSGTTTLGEHLAKELGCAHFDNDVPAVSTNSSRKRIATNHDQIGESTRSSSDDYHYTRMKLALRFAVNLIHTILETTDKTLRLRLSRRGFPI